MNTVIKSLRIQSLRQPATLLIAAATLSLCACYVTPIQPYTTPSPAAQVMSFTPAAPSAVVLIAKLYPNNDYAAPYGVLNGSVTNHLNGRGEITVVQGDEVFRGEATRNSGDSRNGSANGAGSKGGYMSCSYSMNNPSLGTGSCRFNNGAVYRFHLGQ